MADAALVLVAVLRVPAPCALRLSEPVRLLRIRDLVRRPVRFASLLLPSCCRMDRNWPRRIVVELSCLSSILAERLRSLPRRIVSVAAPTALPFGAESVLLRVLVLLIA